MNIHTLKDADLSGKTVLLRVDFNVPLKELKIQDDTRIKAAIPTIEYLLEQNSKIVILSHLGRPKGEFLDHLRLDPVAARLSELIDRPVKKLDSCVGEEIKEAVCSMKERDIVMLENIRCRPEEETCDPNFCKEIASYGDVFVNDAFATAHRRHASTAGLAEHLPSYAGLLLEKEIKELSPLLDNPEQPFTCILGGAKMLTKIGVIKNLIDQCDTFCLGGGIANTFLVAQGYNVGDSLYEPDEVSTAQEIMLMAQKEHDHFFLPTDAILASEPSEDAETVTLPIDNIEGDMKIFDIGPDAIERIVNVVEHSKTIVWNGPVGLYEMAPFSKGSQAIAKAMAKSNATTIIGGGDTIDVLNCCDISHDSFTHVSTGGGAMLKFLGGETLPGIEALKK